MILNFLSSWFYPWVLGFQACTTKPSICCSGDWIQNSVHSWNALFPLSYTRSPWESFQCMGMGGVIQSMSGEAAQWVCMLHSARFAVFCAWCLRKATEHGELSKVENSLIQCSGLSSALSQKVLFFLWEFCIMEKSERWAVGYKWQLETYMWGTVWERIQFFISR